VSPPENRFAVVDTRVASWLLDERPNALADQYRKVIGDRKVLLPFQTVAELRYGAIHAGWGDLRRHSLERQLSKWTILRPDDGAITAYAELRHRFMAQVILLAP
jgi:predicted nucleic acid-binding protein